jgi:hypothetical protein
MPRITLRWPRVLASALVAAWLGAGCCPWRFTTSPGASGVVMDPRTHSPVRGAEVIVSLSKYPPTSIADALANTRPPKATTKEDGRFAVAPERRWGIFIAPVDWCPEFGLLVVKRDGFESTAIPFWSRSTTNVGEVWLQPAAK